MKIQECYAVPGEETIVDVIRPETGRSWINGETLDEIRLRYPGAEVVNFDDWCAAKASRQNTPITWEDSTKERYFQMLEVLPPAAQANEAFLVGEAMDHHVGTGRPRFSCYAKTGRAYRVASRPVTLAEFRQMFGACRNEYVS